MIIRGREGELIRFLLFGARVGNYQMDLWNSANENSRSWALLMIIIMAAESMISRVWGCKERLSSVSTLPPGRES